MAPPSPPAHKILVDIVQELLRQSTSTNQAVAAVTYLSIHAPADLRGTPRLQILEAALQEAAGEGFEMDAGCAVRPSSGGGGDAADGSGSGDGNGKDAVSFETEGGERGRSRAMNGVGHNATSSTSHSTSTSTAAVGGGGKVEALAAADSNAAWPSQLNPIPVR